MAFTFCMNCGEQFDDSLEKCPKCGHIRGAERPNPSPFVVTPNFNSQQNPQNGQQNGGLQNPPPQNDPNGDQQGQNAPQNPQNDGNRYGNPYAGDPYGSQNGNPQNGGWQGGQQQPPYGQNPYGNGQYGNGQYGNGQYNGQYGNGQYGNGQYGNGQFGNGQRPPYYPPTPQRPISVGLLIFSIINIFFGCCQFSMILAIIALVMTIKAKGAENDIEELRYKKNALALNVISAVLFFAEIVISAILIATGTVTLPTACILFFAF